MFKIVYPMFERGRILKKELLLALRDYSFGFAKLQYDGLTDGIIAGCEISVSDRRLTVGPGIVKFQKFIYIMTEPQNVFYEPNEQFVSVKIRFSTTAAASTDFVNYSGNIVLDEDVYLHENELEVCRFKLKQGSRLRNDYFGFDDIQTEYDTINLANTTWAGQDHPGIHSFILKSFAQEALNCQLADPWDITFVSQCLNGEFVHRSFIEAYISHKFNKTANTQMSNLQIYEDLGLCLRDILRGQINKNQSRAKRMKIELN